MFYPVYLPKNKSNKSINTELDIDFMHFLFKSKIILFSCVYYLADILLFKVVASNHATETVEPTLYISVSLAIVTSLIINQSERFLNKN